jgi:hypothetical protein
MSYEPYADFSVVLARHSEGQESSYAIAGNLQCVDIGQTTDPQELYEKLEPYNSPRTKTLTQQQVLDVLTLEVSMFEFRIIKDVIYQLIDWRGRSEDQSIFEEFELCPYDAMERSLFPTCYYGRCSKPYCDLCHSIMVMCRQDDSRNLDTYYKVLQANLLHQVLNIVKQNKLEVFELYRSGPNQVQIDQVEVHLVSICKQRLEEDGIYDVEKYLHETYSDVGDDTLSYYHFARGQAIQNEDGQNNLEELRGRTKNLSIDIDR